MTRPEELRLTWRQTVFTDRSRIRGRILLSAAPTVGLEPFRRYDRLLGKVTIFLVDPPFENIFFKKLPPILADIPLRCVRPDGGDTF